MNWYTINVEGQNGQIRVKASSTRVAINKALSLIDDAILDGARVRAWRGERVKYNYYVCGYSRTSSGATLWGKVPDTPNFDNRKEALAFAATLPGVGFRIGRDAR